MSRKRSKAAEPAGVFSVWKILSGGITGVFLTLVLTFAAALAISNEVLSMESCGWLGPVIIAVSAFFSALLSAWRNNKKLICGFLAAILYGLMMVICGMVLFSAPMQMGRMTLSLAALFAGAFAGVVISGLRD